MLENEGPVLVCMATRAQYAQSFVGETSLGTVVATVCRMAVTARHTSFKYLVVIRFAKFGTRFSVARNAQSGCVLNKNVWKRFSLMRGMTVVASDGTPVMLRMKRLPV